MTDLQAARAFYSDILGCATGRESERWIDFDFFGHQLVAHLVDPDDHPSVAVNSVDGHGVPASHFGLILQWQQFHDMAQRLQDKGVTFAIEPHVRFAGRRGEQSTLFISDPSNNYIEFKSFRNSDALFEKDLERY